MHGPGPWSDKAIEIAELRELRQALRERPHDVETWKRTARLLEAAGRHAEAVQGSAPRQDLARSSAPARGNLQDPESLAALQRLARMPVEAQQQMGFQLHPVHFYSPVNDLSFLQQNPDLWQSPQDPADVDWRPNRQLKLLEQLSAHVPELADVPLGPLPQPTEFCWNNDFFTNMDAAVLYGMVRAFRPRRVVEVGCGWSSLMLRRAVERNESPCDVQQVEPHPNEELLRHVPATWTLHRTILQRAPLSLFDRLQENDVLFYDGSHCARVAGDVNWFFFRILPRLRPGVLVHLHDIFLPDDYPESWIAEGRCWTEQYLLQAFLMNNDRFQILCANAYLSRRFHAEVKRLVGRLRPVGGGSFWMRVVH